MKLTFLSPARKYLKKIKDKGLRDKCSETIDALLGDPTVGVRKYGDLSDMWTCNFRYDGTDYRIAYEFTLGGIGELTIVMIGTHENLYKDLKRYLK